MNKETTIRKYIGSVSVDTANCWIGDPYLLWPDRSDPDQQPSGQSYAVQEIGPTWQDFCRAIDEISQGKTEFKRFSSGIAVHTGYGDGDYPVFATYREDGRIVKIAVEFNTFAEDEE